MSIVPILLSTMVAGTQLTPPKPHPMVGVRSLALSPDGSQIAFVYRGDVWVASSDGGMAVPVTNHVEMDDNPIWSPDGKWIAFATDRHGNWDVYAVPVGGGTSQRITYNSGTEIPTGWSPDGKVILMDASYDKGASGIYGVDVATGQMHEHFVTQFRIDNPVFSPDGKTIAYTHKAMFAWTRPRYEGSGAAQIWTVDAASGATKEIRNSGYSHYWTQFAPDGQKLYTVTVTEKTPSSHKIGEVPVVPFADSSKKTPNVYEVQMNGRIRQVTDYVGGSGTRFLTVANTGKMAYEVEGKVYTMTPGGQPKMVEFNGVLDPKVGLSERLIITDGAAQADISPDLKNVVFNVRRELWSVPVEKGKGPNGADADQLTDYPGSDQEPIYSPDGKSVFFTSDRDGALSLYKMDVATKKIEMFYKTTTDIGGLEVMPGETGLSFWVAGRAGGLFTIPIAGGAAKRILDKPWGSSYAFSPDNKYVAYTRVLQGSGFKYWENSTNVWVKNLNTGEEVNVTRLNVRDNSPAWSADGKYLYFVSDRQGDGIYAIPAQPEEARSTEIELKYEKPTDKVTVDFNMENPAERIRRIVAGGAQGPIVSNPENGDIYFRRSGSIWKSGYDGEGAREIPNASGVGGYKLFKNNLFFIAGGSPRLVDISKPNFPSKTVEFRADWTRDLVAERSAAFHEMWRAYNLSFYDEYFHRRDWANIRDRYEPLLDSVSHRREMATLLNMMVGELESSHSEVSPGPGGEGSESTAHPGFSIDYSYAGPGIKIKDVPKGSPGWYEKTKLNAGEYVMKVNGVDVKANQDFWKLMNGQTSRDLTLTVNGSPSTTGAREVKYRAMSGGAYGGMLQDNRVEWRRKYVEEKSGGKVTYVHIAGMGGGNLNTFNREMWEYVNGKEGVIIDVRENGGGNIADVLIDALERKMHMRYVPRDGDEEKGPGQAWGDKPAVVMHAETSFSNAEMFPAAMNSLGLAELVGMPTPGYVIYTSGGVLVDGTRIRIPGTGVYRVDGTPLENMGEVPDHRVDITPEQYFNNVDPQLDKAIEVIMRKVR